MTKTHILRKLPFSGCFEYMVQIAKEKKMATIDRDGRLPVFFQAWLSETFCGTTRDRHIYQMSFCKVKLAMRGSKLEITVFLLSSNFANQRFHFRINFLQVNPSVDVAAKTNVNCTTHRHFISKSYVSTSMNLA